MPGYFIPKASPWTNARIFRVLGRIRQPPPPPDGGFWVIEENSGCPAIVPLYAESGPEIQADTLRKKHLNLKRRAIVKRMNKRLAVRLDASVTGRVEFR